MRYFAVAAECPPELEARRSFKRKAHGSAGLIGANDLRFGRGRVERIVARGRHGRGGGHHGDGRLDGVARRLTELRAVSAHGATGVGNDCEVLLPALVGGGARGHRDAPSGIYRQASRAIGTPLTTTTRLSEDPPRLETFSWWHCLCKS